MARSVLVQDQFFPAAQALRREFDARFAPENAARGERFVWDYWHVPGQYTQLRTPAYHFFQKIYEAFHNQLVWWGRRTLGCHDVSPTWLSCYVDGCEQRLHADLPHGPWAFVFSLTPWSRKKFSGGETLVMREEILDYWTHIDRFRGLEEEGIFQKIPPRFNRLVVFDPRLPHGVRRVGGVNDVREGRLVVHGWFANPRPFIEGSLGRAELAAKIGEWTESFEILFRETGGVRGLLSLNFRVSAAGRVGGAKILSDSLRSSEHRPEDAARVARFARSLVATSQFKRSRGDSRVTVPFVFAGGEG